MTKPPRAVSAPGKVLLTGGFLVLDRNHTGLVFGLDARIHVHIQPLPTTPGVSLQEIIVHSPQFSNATWRYGYYALPGYGGIKATQLRDASGRNTQPNPFVETALTYALTYISQTIDPVIIEASRITILADDDYYSQPAAKVTDSSTEQHSRFKHFGVPLQDAHKTGLGSSAALVTAFTAAVLSHYLPREEFSIDHRRILHNLAQAAHSAAQGKIGSGFDVASAVYGSCVYRRFSPRCLEMIGDAGSSKFADMLKLMVKEIPVPTEWNMEIAREKVKIPSGLRLVMCDVDCGSKTPGMVKKVLEWRKANPEEARRLWSKLQKKNDDLSAELVKLAGSSSTGYAMLAAIIKDIRALVREMSVASQVPIEPKAQTQLLDACTGLPGVVGGVAPGAGGYDAIALLIENKAEVLERLARRLEGWNFNVDDPGVESTGRVRLLGVREEMEGAKMESLEQYGAWIS